MVVGSLLLFPPIQNCTSITTEQSSNKTERRLEKYCRNMIERCGPEMLRKCCSLEMNMRADERSFRFLFFIAKETKVYICTTGTLRITNSSSDTNLDEGSVCTKGCISYMHKHMCVPGTSVYYIILYTYMCTTLYYIHTYMTKRYLYKVLMNPIETQA